MRSSSSSALTFMGMTVLVFALSSTMVVSKFAMSEGVNKYCFVLYGEALSTLIFLPALLLHFRSSSPPLTLPLLFKFFLLALNGVTANIFGLVGIELSSPTIGTALLNLVQPLTFLLAILFRMEKLEWKSSSSQAKLVGTIVSIGGACIATFYKGHPITFVAAPQQPLLALSPQSKWALGGVFCAGDALMLSFWYILQTMVLKEYPVYILMIFFSHLFGTIIAASFALVIVSDPQAWKVTIDKGLLSIVYTTVAIGVFGCVVVAWCLKTAGPLYVTAFKPIGIVFAVVLGVVFLGDPLCIGSLIGIVVIVCGFYVVIWGKAKEEIHSSDREVGNETAQPPCLTHKTPLLAAP